MSRVAFPDLNTASTLLNVSSPSGCNTFGERACFQTSASASIGIRLPNNRPPVSVIITDLNPPSTKPLLNASRILRVRKMSSVMKESRTNSSYDAR